MRALKAAFSFSTWMTFETMLPEPEPFVGKPRPMTGFLATMSDEQKRLAREHVGDDAHGEALAG